MTREMSDPGSVGVPRSCEDAESVKTQGGNEGGGLQTMQGRASSIVAARPDVATTSAGAATAAGQLINNPVGWADRLVCRETARLPGPLAWLAAGRPSVRPSVGLSGCPISIRRPVTQPSRITECLPNHNSSIRLGFFV